MPATGRVNCFHGNHGKRSLMRYSILTWNAFLATRERGRRVREDIESSIARMSAGETLTMDFSGVEGITASFADECVAKLILERDTGSHTDRGLLIEGANEDVRETLETVLARRKLAAANLTASGEIEALAGPSWLPETLNAALALPSFRATDLAETLGITPQATNNRLRQLVTSGAVTRVRAVPEGGGKQFSYQAAATAHT